MAGVFFTNPLFATQGMGRILFDTREERLKRGEGVVSPFGGVHANPHRPPTACSLFDTMGMSGAVHPAPTYIEPYTGDMLAKIVCGSMSVAMIVGMRDGGKFSFFLIWFICTTLNFFAAKALPQGNGILAHQLATTACGIVAATALCKLFVETVYAGGFGDTESTTAGKKDTTKEKPSTAASSVDGESSSVLTTSRSLEKIGEAKNIVGGVTPHEAAEALRAEIASKGGRRIITEADIKRRMELMNTDKLRESYKNAALAAREQINAQLEANAPHLLAAGSFLGETSARTTAASAVVSGGAAASSQLPRLEASTSHPNLPKSSYSVSGVDTPAASAASKQQSMSALKQFMINSYRVATSTRILVRHIRRNPHTKLAAVMTGLAYYNFRRLDWWATYVPELRSLKGRDESSSGVDVFKGTYAGDIDAELLTFESFRMPKAKI